MSPHSDAVAVLLQIFQSAKRPLSIRRASKLLNAAGYNDGLWTHDGISLLLSESEEFVQLRKGVFTLRTSVLKTNEVSTGKPVDDLEAEPSDRQKTPVFPERMSDVVALRESLGGRDELRAFLAQKMKARVSSIGHQGQSGRRSVAASTSRAEVPIVHTSLSAKVRGKSEPYVERRKDRRLVEDERRGARHQRTELAALPQKIKQALEAAGKPLSFDELRRRIGHRHAAKGQSKLRVTVLVENEKRRHSGLREIFFIGDNHEVGLTSWHLPNRLLELELHMVRDRDEIEELVKRALLNKLADSPIAGFIEALKVMLERNGVVDVQETESKLSEVCILQGAQILNGSEQSIVVFARNVWQETDARMISEMISSLEAGVDHCLIITVGTFTQDAISFVNEQRKPSVQLLDGVVLANTFYDLRLGVRTATWTTCYPDYEFFRSLEI